MHRIRIKYNKSLIFIGHLDMVRLWERAIRRADIPVSYSQGFNPRQKLSFGPPLSLGIASDCEFLDIYLDKWLGPDFVKEDLTKTLPEGIKIIDATNVFPGMESLSSFIKTAVYEIKTNEDASERIKEILALTEIQAERKEKKINIRPMIKCLSQDGGIVTIAVQCDNYGSIKAQEIKALFPQISSIDLKRTQLLP
ncbi:MAG: TIGR03936 family radical SAM-associated protein [Candidatus Margulisiibacteriota bacterium]